MSREFSPDDLRDPRDAPPAPADPLAMEDVRRDSQAPVDRPYPSPLHQPSRSLDDSVRKVPFVRGRAALYDRDLGYQLGESEVRTIADLGKFRAIAAHDLGQQLYRGDHETARRDADRLVRQGLAKKGIFEGSESTPRELLTLTRSGHRLLRATGILPRDQAVYHGFVKPKEANHDADLYLLYQKEAARIEREGGRNLRVVLDYELKRKINRDLARYGAGARKEIADRHGLRVVRNKIPIPDLRIEYETRDGDPARVHLELVTEHYRGASIADKVRAGFSLYTPHGEADHLRRVLDQHELTADILAL